ncbi:Di-copper centre-containing protein [Apiospora kogelbergensis]|uniref:Di-copper centre-containing protein n=1 Tax=Apiospora kogelbergensis TaxID=1337665 RepID=A0AAW0QMD1_9PEZI
MNNTSLFMLVACCLAIWPAVVSAAPRPRPASECRNPPQRLEWRQMSEPEQNSYIDAVLCLTMTESISGIARAINRFDDHQAVHSLQTPNIHWVGHFILWHRYLVATYEKALREECGYKGGQPYWDWSLDARPDDPTSMASFPVDVLGPGKYSFGGNGDPVVPTPVQNPLNLTGGTGGGCVRDGAFTPDRFVVNYGPDPGCLKRDFVPWIFNSFADPKLVQELLDQPDYTSFARTIEKVPTFDTPNIHGSGHFGVGGVLGTMGNAENSPGDPLFYLHHGNLDRILWTWQQQDLETRLNQVGGPVLPMDYGGQNVTLDFTVGLGELAGDATLKQLLDTQSGVLCYTY